MAQQGICLGDAVQLASGGEAVLDPYQRAGTVRARLAADYL